MQCVTELATPLHAAVFYRGDEGFLDAVLPFVLDGIVSGDRVQIALPTRNLALLQEALGANAGEVDFVDMADAGRNPARAFAMVSAALDSAPPGVRIRMVGEPVWPGRDPDEYLACLENEALVNTAWAGGRMLALCPYDAKNLPDDVLADARRTHPFVGCDGATAPSLDYASEQVLAECNTPLSRDPAAATYRLRELRDLGAARQFALAEARLLGLCEERMGDLSLVITELATNSLEYTTGGCRLAIWRRPFHLICEVRDEGRLDDPLAGRRLPPPHSVGGRGLLLVNALADLVRIHTAETCTAIQVHLALTPMHEENP